MKTKLWFIVFIILLAMAVTACAAPAPAPAAESPAAEAPAAAEPAEEATAAPDEKVTLLVWDQFGEETVTDVVDQIYAGFMEKHPNIEIKREIVPYDQLNTTARTALASGTGPDVVYHDVVPTQELVDAGLILQLDSADDEFGWRDRFYPTGLSWTIRDGKLWGLGLESEFVGIFNNETLFEQEGLEVPQTLSEVLAFCKEASARGFVPLAHSQNPGWQNYFSFTMPIHNYVGVDNIEKLIFEDEGSWNSEGMVAAMKATYGDMKDAGCFVPDLNALDYDGAIDLFVNGEAFMFPTGTWIVDRLLEFSKENDVTMMPWFDMETGQPRVYTMGMGSAYYVSSNTKHPKEAEMFLDYLFSDEAVPIWIEGASKIPPVPTDTAALDLDPLQKFVIDTLEEAGTGTGDLKLGWDVDLITPPAFNEMLQSGFQAVFAGTKTVEEQLDDLQKLWEERNQ